MIRVGTIKYNKGKKIFPEFDGFKRIEVMTPSTEYGCIGPYCLKDESGRIMENIFQFSKCYKAVPKTVCTYSRYNKTVIWDHPNEIHMDDNREVNEKYWAWRKKGMNNKYAIRYPVGLKFRHNCQYALSENGQKYDYIESRKEIYRPVYDSLVKKHDKYKELKNMLDNGINLLIVEIDGPKEESLDYYKEIYDVNDNFIENSTILVTDENMKIMFK